VEAEFWLDSWEREGGCIGFHRKDIHPYVQTYAPAELLRGKRVLVPLCGKTNDLMWFRQHAAHVVGVELVQKAIGQFFSEQNLPYEQPDESRYEAERLTILNRDFFSLQPDEIGPIDLVYDRAALVALPLDLRLRYIRKLNELVPVGSQQLLITLEYAPTLAEPPFSITPAEVADYYGAAYAIDHIEQPELPQHGMVRKFKLDFLKEHAFLLTRTQDSGLRIQDEEVRSQELVVA
jgi:thiopurine S-methyltransferase